MTAVIALVMAGIGLLMIVAGLILRRSESKSWEREVSTYDNERRIYAERAPGSYSQPPREPSRPKSDAKFLVIAGVSFATLMMVFFGFRGITSVDAGEVLVPVQFGKVLQPVETEGITFISPFAGRVRMPVRTVELTFAGASTTGEEESGLRSIRALSSEGAQVDVDVTVLYHVDPTMAGDVYRTVSTRWEEVLVIPRARNTVRDCLPQYSFEDARTSLRGEASQCVLDSMQAALASRGIVIEDILLRDMRADAQLQKAIDAKLEAQSNAARSRFIQEQAKVEAETVVIEAAAAAQVDIERAQGQARAIVLKADAEAQANRVIALSLTDDLITLRLYENLGNKTVLLGGDSGVLPILPINP